MTTFEAAAYVDTTWNFGCRSYSVSSLFYTSVMLIYPGDPFKGVQLLSFTILMVMPVTSVWTEAKVQSLSSFSHCLGLFKMEVIPMTDLKILFWFLSYPLAWSVWIEEASHLSPVCWPSPPSLSIPILVQPNHTSPSLHTSDFYLFIQCTAVAVGSSLQSSLSLVTIYRFIVQQEIYEWVNE